ncbi:PD40 domain-containing protein [Paractinoplanes toevensis]|uniref:Uncharacterized protein n=1 Tax=Paractinoplanes toevensis TaxID=571911 RepID=A0A919WAM9_9ACTN|nr:PD40 domain-containing protein [Actinoplanes toevensis]GIM96714.1 hypothetical protein Ato02nite_085070 [Actinoplanes toevensis]
MTTQLAKTAIGAALLGSLAVGAAPAAAAPAGTSRISLDSNGGQAAEYRSEPFAASTDGRYVAFTSAAPNLVPGDTNETWDVLVRDRRAGTTTLVSRSGAGVPGNSSSYGQAMSPDGRYVSFTSDATDLVPGDTNGAYDGFVRDLRTGTTSRVTLTSGGTQANARSYAPAISADARYVAFVSDATDVVPGDTDGVADVFLRDRRAGTTVRVSAGGPADAPAISADGRYVTYTSGGKVLVYDRRSGGTVVVAGQTAAGPAISADGRYVTFTSEGKVLVHDRRSGNTIVVAGGPSAGPAISADGRYVTFTSDATNLVAGDTNGVSDVFRRDLRLGTTVRVSLTAGGAQAADVSYAGVITGDGRSVAFASAATDLVPGDTNGVTDTFLRHLSD